MINPMQLEEYVIRPVLRNMGFESRSAIQLLLLTAAQESHMGTYIHQLGGGPALGIYQMEPRTHDDIWNNWLGYKPKMHAKVNSWSTLDMKQAKQMAGNLYYATAMARCHYLRVPSALPESEDIEGLAMYWKKHYNTHLGHGRVEQAVKSYNRYVVGN